MTTITVIVPAYNAEATLARCVDSILAQEGVQVELVIVDDGSTDETLPIANLAAERDSRVRVIHQGNAGRCVARNIGIDAASGEWVAFCDADDFLLPGALEVMAHLGGEGVSAIWAGYTKPESVWPVYDGDDRLVCMVPPAALARKIVKCDARILECGGFSFDADGLAERSSWGKLFRRSELVNGGSARFREGLRFGEDALFNIEFLAASKGMVVVTASPVYYYDINANGTVMSFHAVDASCLASFCAAVDAVIGPLVNRVHLGLAQRDVIDFAGREIATVVYRAARFSASLKEAGGSIACAMGDERVRSAWLGMKPTHARYSVLRRILYMLMKCGRADVAILLYRLLLRLKGEPLQALTRTRQ